MRKPDRTPTCPRTLAPIRTAHIASTGSHPPTRQNPSRSEARPRKATSFGQIELLTDGHVCEMERRAARALSGSFRGSSTNCHERTCTGSRSPRGETPAELPRDSAGLSWRRPLLSQLLHINARGTRAQNGKEWELPLDGTTIRPCERACTPIKGLFTISLCRCPMHWGCW